MTTQVTEAPPGLQWLQSTISELRGEMEGLRKKAVGQGMRIAALEGDLKIVRRENEELRTELASANEQLDESSASMRAAVKTDVLSDIEQLSARDKAIATVLVVLAAKVMASGQESLARLGLPDDVVRTVRGLVFGFTGDSVTPVVSGSIS